jgi:ABC-type nitrate/sulfonate/bicarbonate transport system ATPase subunit
MDGSTNTDIQSMKGEKFGEGVCLDHVVLKYPGRELAVLNQYSQLFAKGKVHALIGESGCGKSTILKLLSQLMDPDSGSVRFWEGIRIAYVSQDQKIFSRTIRENVTHSTDPTKFADEDVWEALREAEIIDWVRSLPNGPDTLLEGGESMISGGQLQRLHLAHLFCTCQDADLVMLDEVLSAVDQANRGILITRLQRFLKGKTAVIITHHSEMLRICDTIHEMAAPTQPNALSRITRTGLATFGSPSISMLFSDPSTISGVTRMSLKRAQSDASPRYSDSVRMPRLSSKRVTALARVKRTQSDDTRYAPGMTASIMGVESQGIKFTILSQEADNKIHRWNESNSPELSVAESNSVKINSKADGQVFEV